MKKMSTYYFAALAAANGFLVCFMSDFNGDITTAWHRLLEGEALPVVSQMFASCPQWPWFFVAFSTVGMTVSLATKIRSETLCHVVILGIAAEAVVLFLAMVAYAVPLIPMPLYRLQ